LLTCYSRAHLGISLGKTQDLLHDFFGLTLSRDGLLGHLRWGGQLFAPVVEELLELLRQSPVVQGDETGWRINGQTASAWAFSPSPQTRSSTLSPPTRRGYDDRTQKARFNTGLSETYP